MAVKSASSMAMLQATTNYAYSENENTEMFLPAALRATQSAGI